MKDFFTLIKAIIVFLPLMLTIFSKLNATTHTVHVKDHQFVPGAFNALVGDTVLWVWDNGTHTTTGTAVNIPAGAATWDAPIDASNQSFEYVITVAGKYFYFSKLDGDMSASFTATGTLPVQLVNFTVTNTKNSKAFISWGTVSEQNTSYFSLQKSTDAVKFIEIAKINAAGNSAALQLYNYTDNNISAANKYLYYTLTIIDKDGKKTMADIITFKNNAANIKLITALSPNPVSNSGYLRLQFNADAEGKMFAQVYNAGGSLIKQTETEAAPGLNNYDLYLNNLAKGIYKIVFKLHDITDTKTIVVQ